MTELLTKAEAQRIRREALDAGSQVVVAGMLARVREAAELEGVSASEWWRRAARAVLGVEELPKR